MRVRKGVGLWQNSGVKTFLACWITWSPFYEKYNITILINTQQKAFQIIVKATYPITFCVRFFSIR